jgi:hypothetical protein
MSQLNQVNEYRRVKTAGVTELVQVNDRWLVPSNVVMVTWESYTTFTQFRVHMLDGTSFITDWSAVSGLQNWSEPLSNTN